MNVYNDPNSFPVKYLWAVRLYVPSSLFGCGLSTRTQDFHPKALNLGLYEEYALCGTFYAFLTEKGLRTLPQAPLGAWVTISVRCLSASRDDKITLQLRLGSVMVCLHALLRVMEQYVAGWRPLKSFP